MYPVRGRIEFKQQMNVNSDFFRKRSPSRMNFFDFYQLPKHWL